MSANASAITNSIGSTFGTQQTKRPVVLIPGFMGESQDFDALIAELENLGHFEIEIFDPSRRLPELTQRKISEIGSDLVVGFKNWLKGRELSQVHGLVGYSMGGRLLQEMVRVNNRIATRYIILSSRVALPLERERQDRLASDLSWSEKFRCLDWDQLQSEWNSQLVFKATSRELDRSEWKENRELLANVMAKWSLGHQNPIDATTIPNCTWIVGERDEKFVRLMNDLPVSIKKVVLENAGHRLHLDQPMNLAKIISSELSRLPNY